MRKLIKSLVILTFRVKLVNVSWDCGMSDCERTTHPLPRGGTDFMGPRQELLRVRPTRYREVVLTSWDRGLSDRQSMPLHYKKKGSPRIIWVTLSG